MPLTNQLQELKVCILTYIGRVYTFTKFHITLKRSGWKLHFSLCWYGTEWTNTGHTHMKFIQHLIIFMIAVAFDSDVDVLW